MPGPRPCADVIDELAPAPGEPIVDKLGYGAFHGTDLDARLRALGVRSLVVTGTVTQICVEETAREAFHHGYATTIVADAVSSFAPDLHAATLRNFAMKFGWVSDADEVIAALPPPPGEPWLSAGRDSEEPASIAAATGSGTDVPPVQPIRRPP